MASISSRTSPSVRQTPKLKQILIIGRLTGGRWRAFQFILENLERLAKTLPPAHYQIVGRIPDERRAALMNQLSIIGSRIAPSTIETLGFVKDLPILIRNSDAAIAAGRSALECLAQGRPVLFLGEGGVHRDLPAGALAAGAPDEFWRPSGTRGFQSRAI